MTTLTQNPTPSTHHRHQPLFHKETTLQCAVCGTVYDESPSYVCTNCFGPTEINYRIDASAAVLKHRIETRPRNLWRYEDFLPGKSPKASLHTGCTPLQRAPLIEQEFGIGKVWIKNETANPTHSFKDRVVSVALAQAQRFGFETVACASTGNLAHSLAAHAAAAGLEAYVIVPSSVEAGKLAAAAAFDATLIRVEGNYDGVNRLCSEIADEYGWGFVNINLRPYYAEGSKTVAFEIIEDLHWKTPSHVFIPIASGSLYTKINKGFKQFADAGLSHGDTPSLYGIQADGCSPVAVAHAAGHTACYPQVPDTIAHSLAIGNPADGPFALDVAKETNGDILSVSDDAIREGISYLAKRTGILTEPAGGVTTAGFLQAARAGKLGKSDECVICITGDGLKATETLPSSAGISLPDTKLGTLQTALAN